MADLTLPGTIPGLLRRGSPVTKDGWTGGAVVAKVRDLSVVVVSEDGPSWPFARPASLRLDLTDATGRAHAAWWLASAVGLHSPTTSRWSPGASVYTIESDAQSAPWVRTFTPTGSLWSGERVPALDDLDPNNDRRLPDGSRWVDAEALRRVVLHVAGLPPA